MHIIMYNLAVNSSQHCSKKFSAMEGADLVEGLLND